MRLIAVAAFLFAATARAHAGALPEGLKGIWDTESVAVDQQDTIHQTYRRDDPELMATSLVLQGRTVAFSFGHLECSQTNWRPQRSSWQSLFAKGFPRPRVGGRPGAPSLEDFGVKITQTKTTAYSVCPSPGAQLPLGSWIALDDPNRLFLHYDGQLLFVLKRRLPDARPAPSFNCQAASSNAERAICQDFTLAAWDRSVELAIRQLVETWPDKRDVLMKAQEKWIRQRNECNTETKCIDESLRRRVEELVWQRKNG